MAMIVMTTSSSINVNPTRRPGFDDTWRILHLSVGIRPGSVGWNRTAETRRSYGTTNVDPRGRPDNRYRFPAPRNHNQSLLYVNICSLPTQQKNVTASRKYKGAVDG